MKDAAAPTRTLSDATRAAIEREVTRYPELAHQPDPRAAAGAVRDGLAQRGRDRRGRRVGGRGPERAGKPGELLRHVLPGAGRPQRHQLLQRLRLLSEWRRSASSTTSRRRSGSRSAARPPTASSRCQPMECLAGCGIAPVLLVDGEYHGNLTRRRSTPSSTPCGPKPRPTRRPLRAMSRGRAASDRSLLIAHCSLLGEKPCHR